MRGRGTDLNPPNRFEALRFEEDPELGAEPQSGPKTQYLRDPARSIIATNDSPDVGFNASVNPYRGCEHGCIYCFARPSHEYLGFSAGLDFESKILVKTEAPQLLREALMKKSWTPQVVAMSGVTDCYQPIEKKLRITRGCLDVLLEFRNPCIIITKNHLVTRDIDLLAQLAAFNAVAVMVSVTSLDPELALKMEPRASQPAFRVEAIAKLAQAGVPVGVMIGPVLPAINDHEIPHILEAAYAAGARRAGYNLLRLPYGVKDLFSDWLERYFPERKMKVLHRIQDMRDGKLNDPQFGSRMRGEGFFAKQLKHFFKLSCRKAGFPERSVDLSTAHFRRPLTGQMEMFGA